MSASLQQWTHVENKPRDNNSIDKEKGDKISNNFIKTNFFFEQ